METLNYKELKKEFRKKQKELKSRKADKEFETTEEAKLKAKAYASKNYNKIKQDEFWKYLMSEHKLESA